MSDRFYSLRFTGVKMRLCILAIAVLSLLPLVAGSKATKWDKDALINKADYIYLESERQKALDRNDAYFELLGSAVRLDPSDKSMAFDYGFYEIVLDGKDTANIRRGYNRMADYFNAHPEDIYNALTYARISEMLGQADKARSAWQRIHSIYPSRSEIAMRYAEVMLGSPDDKDRQKGIAAYDSIEHAEGRDLQITNMKIHYYLQKEDTVKALSELSELLKAFPRSSQVASYAGDVNNVLGKREAALNYYRTACQNDSTNGYAYYALANFYKSIGDTVAYNKEIVNALTKKSLDVETKLKILGSYIKGENPGIDNDSVEDVIEGVFVDSVSDSMPASPAVMSREKHIDDLFKVLIDEHPHEPDVFGFYASYLTSIPDYAGAAEALSSKLDIEPNDLAGWQGLITLDMRSNDLQGAVDDANRALRYFPDNTQLLLLLAGALQQQQQYKEALVPLRRAYELTDTADLEARSLVLTGIGDAYYAMGQKDSAYKEYNEAIRLDPGNITALNNSAYYLACENKNLDKALEMSKAALAGNPDSPTTLDTYAWVLFKLKRYDEALKYITRVMELIPPEERRGEELDHAGDINFMTGNRAEALKYWKEALELDKHNELLKRKVKNKTIFFE